jgi:hypothetical protein
MKTALILIVIIVAIAAYFFYRKTQATRTLELTKSKTVTPKSQYRCVKIEPSYNACKTALAMREKPILMNEMPVLPLQNCDKSKCDCKFTRHNDRRMNNRREDVNIAGQIISEVNNKRERKDRRKSTIKPS